MTRRSEPRPNCTYCRGAGIISVSKDPDEIIDCVCTDPVDALAAVPCGASVAEFAEATLGAPLMPWQREILGALMVGDRITVRHEGGNTVTGTVEQVLSTHLAKGWTLDRIDAEWEYRGHVMNALGRHVLSDWTDEETARLIARGLRTGERGWVERRRKAGVVERMPEAVSTDG